MALGIVQGLIRALGAGAAVCLWVFASPAAAQVPLKDSPLDLEFRIEDFSASREFNFGLDSEGPVSVRQRARPDYDPRGIPMGSFLIFPAVGTGLIYDSNIFIAPTDEIQDTIIQSVARLLVASEWERHAFDLKLGAIDNRYEKRDDQSYTDLYAGASGRIDVNHRLAFYPSASASRLHETPGGIFSPTDTVVPITYDLYDNQFTTKSYWGRFDSTSTFQFIHLNYGDGRAEDGTIIDQSFRDGDIIQQFSETGFTLSEGYRAVLETVFNTRNFRSTPADDLDSHGYLVRGGMAFELSRLIRAKYLAGYLSQDYDNPIVPDLGTFTYLAALIWDPTPLMTITIESERRLNQYKSESADRLLETVAGLRLDYELRRNLIVSPSYYIVFRDFQDSTRKDTDQTFGFVVDYIANPNLNVLLRYDYTVRDSNDPDSDYVQNLVSAKLVAQF